MTKLDFSRFWTSVARPIFNFCLVPPQALHFPRFICVLKRFKTAIFAEDEPSLFDKSFKGRNEEFLMCCIISLQISFIRRRDFHILTNGHSVYTNDQRIEVFHAAKSHDWYLVIKRANHNDTGIYECQVRV